MRSYFDFAEVEDEVKTNAPPIVYKYRDWDNEFHKSILTESVIWFAHPKDLNDPDDIRTPAQFNYSEIDDPRFLERLKYHTQTKYSHLNTESRDFKTILENQFDIIKTNPQVYFENNYKALRESNLYDRFGLFSVSKKPLIEKMWEDYGNSSKGFCIGFETLPLSKDLGMAFGAVAYSDAPTPFSLINPIDYKKRDEMFTKGTKWGFEEEFRFLTLRIKNNSDRRIVVDRKIIKEVILGSDISDKNKSEIVTVLKSRYNSNVKLYKVKSSTSSHGFIMEDLSY